MTDAEILRQSEMGRLFFGPYRAPQVKPGQELTCAIHGLCIVYGEHGPIGWPRAKPRGHSRPIVCGDLLRAIQDETAGAIALHWDVHPATVSRWKRVLGLPSMSRAATLIKGAQMRSKRAARPDLHVRPGAESVSTLTLRERRKYGRESAGARVYTDRDDTVLRELGPCRLAAERLGRPLSSLRKRAWTLGITSAAARGTEHGCKRCGYVWTSLLPHKPRKCANLACRSLAWERPRKVTASPKP